ncbi:SDR family NAD(P)-dependent oxidoreductase [Moorena sp. SIO3H5]|uniref:SDR family NAD(P)-dependent oxidoreductase n=1 Tax=Moorena sp. SIO3H5 TaxID=2607834 RepID=UPI0013BABCC3|nr:SDR family NAD(P)-dependent oxidoreductase [Moorena sp. SIO3H5]NEO69655.1 SDR family NAD(P)-dependent oxidoreductase [Moorena sp. SIO3H5]
MESRLTIVTGASGALGNSFVEHFIQQENTTCVAISRTPMETDALHCKFDLLDSQAAEQAITNLDLSEVSDVILIHGVGKFKYEIETETPEADWDDKGIDDEIFSSNYHTFVNVAQPLVEKLNQEHQCNRQTTLALCGFGSVTDKYKIPFWRSYTYAKDTLRSYIQDLAQSEDWQGLIRGRFINVSTTDTGNENKLRPNATAEEKKYWLKPEKIVQQSLESLESFQPLWQEIDVYEPMPGFEPDDYYSNYDKIQEKWQRQMGVPSSLT